MHRIKMTPECSEGLIYHIWNKNRKICQWRRRGQTFESSITQDFPHHFHPIFRRLAILSQRNHKESFLLQQVLYVDNKQKRSRTSHHYFSSRSLFQRAVCFLIDLCVFPVSVTITICLLSSKSWKHQDFPLSLIFIICPAPRDWTFSIWLGGNKDGEDNLDNDTSRTQQDCSESLVWYTNELTPNFFVWCNPTGIIFNERNIFFSVTSCLLSSVGGCKRYVISSRRAHTRYAWDDHWSAWFHNCSKDAALDMNGASCSFCGLKDIKRDDHLRRLNSQAHTPFSGHQTCPLLEIKLSFSEFQANGQNALVIADSSSKYKPF